MVTDDELVSRRMAALDEIRPPLLDAQKYLSEDHYRTFCKSLPGAADAYLDGGKGCLLNDWRFDSRALDYVGWSGIIEDLKERDNQLIQAQEEYARYMNDVNNDIKGFKEYLDLQKRPQFAYPPALAKYRPRLWCSLRLPSLEEVATWAKPQIQSVVPCSFADSVTWKLKTGVLTLPYATYALCNIPCLTWHFRISLMPRAEMELADSDAFTKTFCGYEYEMRIVGERLGSLYLGPVDWGIQKGFTTPLVLLVGLANGELESDGVEVTEQDSSSTTFHVRGYDGLVIVHGSFRQFMMDLSKDKSLADGLRGAGVIDQTTAQLVEKKLSELSSPATSGVPTGKASDDNREVEARLENMGYNKTAIGVAMQSAQLLPGMSIEDKVKEVLKYAQT